MSLFDRLTEPVSDLIKQPLVAIAGRSSDRLALHVERLAGEVEAALTEAKRRRALHDETAFAMEIGDKTRDSNRLDDLRIAAEKAEARHTDRTAQLTMARAALSSALADDARARHAQEFTAAQQKRRERLQHGVALCKAIEAVAEHWSKLCDANQGLHNTVPNVAAVLDLDGALMRPAQMAGAVKVELLRLRADFMGEIAEPHKLEPLQAKFERTDAYLARRLDEAATLPE